MIMEAANEETFGVIIMEKVSTRNEERVTGETEGARGEMTKRKAQFFIKSLQNPLMCYFNYVVLSVIWLSQSKPWATCGDTP